MSPWKIGRQQHAGLAGAVGGVRKDWFRPWPTCEGIRQSSIGEFVDEAQLVGDAVFAGPIGVDGDSLGLGGAAGGAPARERPAGPSVDAFVKVRDRVVAARCSSPSRLDKILEIRRFES